jgi:anaerobic ribonucleoside-triphosphate reductase activating protein
MLNNLDVLIDGRFIEEQKDEHLKFRGSTNQRVIDVQKSLKDNKTHLYID